MKKQTVIAMLTAACAAFCGAEDVFREAREKSVRFSSMSSNEIAAVRRQAVRGVCDLELVPPVLDVNPDPEKFGFGKLGFAMNGGMARTKGGRLWSVWVAGGDSTKAFNVGSWSDDGGKTWTGTRFRIGSEEPAIMIGMSGVSVSYPIPNLWAAPDGSLRLYVYQAVGMFNQRGVTFEFICRDPDAKEPKWEAPRFLCYGSIHNKPIVLRNGTWILPNDFEDMDWLKINPFPDLDRYRGCGVLASRDQGRTWERRGYARPEGEHHHCEHSIVQLGDGSLHMLMRTGKGLMESRSTDEGRTWTPPKPPENVRQPVARAAYIRLRSGRHLLIKNGGTALELGDTERDGRTRITAFISEDEGRTWKGGLSLDDRPKVAYPDAFEGEDGYIYVSYDHDRWSRGDEILFARFRERDVLAGRFLDDDHWVRKPVFSARNGGRPPVAEAPRPAKTAEEALALAYRTYDYVAKSVPTQQLARLKWELDADARWLGNAKNEVERTVVEKQIRSVRRRILFRHPDLAFDRLLVNQRGLPYASEAGMTDQYTGRFSRPGPGLCVISNWKLAPHKTVLLEGKLPKGCTLNPTMHWDAKRVLFAFNDHTRPLPEGAEKVKAPTLFHRSYHEGDPKLKVMEESIHEWIREMDPEHPAYNPEFGGEQSMLNHRYFIYEAATDGSWVRQLTGTADDPMTTAGGRQTVPVEDADPCYLPGGKGIVFNSTRSQTFGRCHGGRFNPSFLLHIADVDGRNIRQFAFGEANEWNPSVLDDGRLVYTRWDYIHRNAITTTGLWAVRPDGTGVSHYYGSYSLQTFTLSQARQIPGTHKVVAVGCPHHLYTAGSLAIIDTQVGEDGEEPLLRLTPEIPFPEAKLPHEDRFKIPGTFNSPMPVNDTLFFCSYSDDPLWYPEDHPHHAYPEWMAAWQTPRSYGVWLVDTLGGRELIYQDPEFSTFDPIPVVPRREPPVLASVLPPQPAVVDPERDYGTCYVSDVYDCRYPFERGCVKVLRLNRIYGQTTAAHAGNGRIDVVKEPLGVVPVDEDGSCAFRIPAGVPIQLQAVDAKGKAVMTMRSFIYSQKGEFQGCAGCHEKKYGGNSYQANPSRGMKAAVPKPEIKGLARGPFSFARNVQPVFDRRCISCHGLGKAFSLIGVKTAVGNLRTRKLLGEAVAYQETQESKPRDYFAAASGLVRKLEAGHCRAITEDEMRRIYLWLDLNAAADCWGGGYSWYRPELREIDPEGEKALRAAIRATLGETVAAQPFDALVNRGDEALSRILELVPAADRTRFLELARKSLKPHPHGDVAGTCGRDDDCVCNSCWVRRGGYNKPVQLPRQSSVWVEGKQRELTASFRASFDWTGAGEPTLEIAASAVYRAFLNGEFVGWGPARTVYGFTRVDRWPLKPRQGSNTLTIEVAGYRFESYQYNVGEPFLSATVRDGARTVVSTPADFEAVEVPRATKGPKYSRQRGFVAEAYEIDRAGAAWRTGGATSLPRLKIVPAASPKLLPRDVPYPDFTVNRAFVPVKDAKGTDILHLGAIDSGFVGLEVVCKEPGRIVFEFDEALGTNGVIDLARNGDPLTSWHAMYNRLVWDVKEAGAYQLETIEPYTLKYAQIRVEGGAFPSVRPYLRRCRNALVAKARLESDDPELQMLFAAAKNSLAQNAVDILTDCPSRERVGWLCDTFFSSEALARLTGDHSIEREYLLNFTRTDDFGKNVPKGAIPGFMPSRRGGVMPTYMMWYAIQCCAAADRMAPGERASFLAAVGPRITGVFAWLAGFEEEGLLEDLPGWVFVEWSKANDYVKGVNYPANMLWAYALERSGRLLGRTDWIDRAQNVRAAVLRQSFDGTVFHDQALRGADGGLARTEEAKTETCQYYAFFTGLATPSTKPELWRMLVEELGPNRRGHADMVASDAFIGWLLRLELLSRYGERERLISDMKAYYGPMAKESGTLWEFADGHDSRCHAIGSYIAVLLLRDRR